MSYYNTRIQSLSEETCKVLCLIAYYGKNISFQNLEKYAKAEGIKKKTLEESLQKLSADGMCDSKYVYLLDGEGYFIQPFWYLPALKYLLMEHPEWIDNIKSNYTCQDAVIVKLQQVVSDYFKNKNKRISYQCTSYQYLTFSHTCIQQHLIVNCIL